MIIDWYNTKTSIIDKINKKGTGEIIVGSKMMYTSAEIYRILEDEITTLKVLPGEYIGEVDIGKRFGVSRTPIRDVFKKLEYNNLIKVIPQKGTIIKPIDLSKISEYMFGRKAIELAVIKEVMGTITPYRMAKLEMLLINQANILNDGTIDLTERSHAFFKADNEFHKELFKYASKETLWDMFSVKTPDYQRFRAVVAEHSQQESLTTLYEEHQKMLGFMTSKDMASIEEIFNHHIYRGMGSISDILKEKSSYFSM